MRRGHCALMFTATPLPPHVVRVCDPRCVGVSHLSSVPPPPAQGPTIEPVVSKLEKFILYETAAFLLLVGGDKKQSCYRVMRLDRNASTRVRTSVRGRKLVRLTDILKEDDCFYTHRELKELLDNLARQGGLVRLAVGHGVLGFVRFMDCYYVVLITQRRKVGSIGGNNVYGIKATGTCLYCWCSCCS